MIQLTRETLRTKLIEIKQNEFELPNSEEYAEYVPYLFTYIGDLDPVLRDELIYEVFATWIANDFFTAEQMMSYLEKCIDEEHLLYHLGDKENASVFTRTFSALIIASIVERHVAHEFITEEKLQRICDTVVHYYEKEQDYRGYVEQYGWAHSAAHGADALMELAKCKELSKNNLQQICHAVRSKICQGEYVYIDREPNRIARILGQLAKRHTMTEGEMIQWMEELKNNESDEESCAFFHERVNMENFFRCLYFELKQYGASANLLDYIEERTGI